MKHLKRFNENIDKEDIDNIFIDFKDKYEIHDSEVLKGPYGVYIRFNLHKKFLKEIEDKYKGSSLKGYKNFFQQEFIKSEEFETMMDRMLEIGYKFERILSHIKEYGTSDYFAEVSILFKKIEPNPEKRIVENVDTEDIDNIFIDFKDKYEIHDDVYIHHFNIRGNKGFSINFIINSDILIKIEKEFINIGFYGGFSYETRHKFEDFVKKDIKSSDEFQETKDRVEEIGYKFDKISVYFDNDDDDKSIAEITILFDKIKNKKILENISEKEEIFSELESISFILEDEGFKILFNPIKVISDGVYRSASNYSNAILIEIFFREKYRDDPNGNRAYDVLSNSDTLDEYIDRIEEICNIHKYKITKIRKNIGPFHILIEKI